MERRRVEGRSSLLRPFGSAWARAAAVGGRQAAGAGAAQQPRDGLQQLGDVQRLGVKFDPRLPPTRVSLAAKLVFLVDWLLADMAEEEAALAQI